ncbi:MAG TPA: hypothetical protein DDY29_11680 [Rhodobacteraceae bacterium]|jgi:uncharacterized protein YggE|nr:hypothetical protein [Paracoccaceae bacterium]
MRCMFLFLALSVLAVPPASAQDIGAQLRVTATGEATAPPDIAHLRAGAVAAEPTAAAALDATSVAMADILAMLDAAGIAEPDIRTTELRLSPRYDRSGGSLQGETRIAGYEARNIVEVTVRDLDALGPLLDELARAGANEIGAIRFDLSNAAALRDEARIAAVAEARRKAELLAGAAGVALGPLIALTEGTPGVERPMMGDMVMAAAPSGVPMAEGTQTVEASVTAIYRIGD